MDYNKKAAKWQTTLLEGGNSDIENICISDDKLMHTSKSGTSQADALYYCMRENGKRVAEYSGKKNHSGKAMRSEQFFIKERRKVIFVQGKEAYGFGFGDKECDRSIVLYMRHGTVAMLIWSEASSPEINVMLEINMENPESLDSLIEFMKKETDSDSVHERKERGDFH